MKFVLMRYHFERQEKLMLDLFDFRTNQNIEVYISMKYWYEKQRVVRVLNDILHILSVKSVEHSLGEWFNIVKEYYVYENRT